jgi:hypothetical protein
MASRNASTCHPCTARTGGTPERVAASGLVKSGCLPTEHELVATHAALERLCRPQHLVSGVATTPRVGAPPGSKTRWTVARDGGRLGC